MSNEGFRPQAEQRAFDDRLAREAAAREAEPVTLSIEDALAALPDGEKVHTFLGFIGADWPREKIIAAIHASPDIGITGPMAQAMGHGIAIQHPDTKNALFVATRHRTDGVKR